MENLDTNKISNAIEAILFWKGESVSIKKLAEILKAQTSQIEEALKLLEGRLMGGIVMLRNENEVELRTSKEASLILEELSKEELSRELTKPQLETLSIVLYKGPIKRSEIDYIRGVNSQFILRHLEMRGLVEKRPSLSDARANEYVPTNELFSHLGITKIEELPEFDVLKKKVEEFVETKVEEEKEE